MSFFLSLAGSGRHLQEPGGSGGRQPGDSFTLSDRPPVEFSLSPEASYESMSISHLQRRGLLKSVSMAVDLIMAHFGSSRDPEEKIRLGNSSRSPSIGGLVLEHLCPTIQNILQDGLRDHKLDLIVGQRPNHSWSTVEAFTQSGPSTRVLHSLVIKVRQCSQLTSHCMRLRAFIMGLLNLRSLEFWLSHIHSQTDVVMAHYHPWGFLPMSQGRCQPLFQELLLLLQPLSVLPFDLNLLLEPRLLQNRHLCCEEPGVHPPPPCSTLLIGSWPALGADTQPGAPTAGWGPRDHSRPRMGSHLQPDSQGERRGFMRKDMGEGRVGEANRSLWCIPGPGRWQRQPAHVEGVVEGVVEGEDCSRYGMGIQSGVQSGMEGRRGESRQRRRGEGERGRGEGERGRGKGGKDTSRLRVDPEGESPSQSGLRWAKLFGSGVDSSTNVQRGCQSFNGAPNKRRPSQWLQLDRSQLGLLAQSVWSGRRPGPGSGPEPGRDRRHT